MSFRRQPVLEPSVEANLMQSIYPRWKSGMKGKEIAKELNFGKPILSKTNAQTGEIIAFPNPYAKIRQNYLYYYRNKWQKLHEEDPKKYPLKFEPRGDSRFKNEKGTRYKVPPEEIGLITAENFLEALENSKFNKATAKLNDTFRKARAFLIMLFWTPLRSSEIRGLKIDDFIISSEDIKINLYRKKKHYREHDKQEPIHILRAFPLVEELVSYLEDEEWKTVKWKKEKGRRKLKLNEKLEVQYNLRPFNFGADTANMYVKEVFPDAYCHYFRFRFLTSGSQDPRTSINELKIKSGLTLQALDTYLNPPEKAEREFNMRELERLKKRGLVDTKDT